MVQTRANGVFTPGIYRKIKITPSLLAPKNKFVKKANNIRLNGIAGLNEFKNQLSTLIIDNLKSKGVCLRQGKFVISTEIEYFLKKNIQLPKYLFTIRQF